MVLAIASENEAKVAALRRVCNAVFDAHHIIAVSAPSGVAETPTSDAEAIEGCRNRLSAMQAKHAETVDFWIALEGLIERSSFGDFVYGWAAVRKGDDGPVFYGCSGKVMLPMGLLDDMPAGAKLSTFVKQRLDTDCNSEIDVLGTNGFLTRGLYDRTKEFETAIQCALGVALNTNNFRDSVS